MKGERERERERWFVSESGNYCTMSFSQDGRKNGEFIIWSGGISFSKLRAKLKPVMRRGVVMFGCNVLGELKSFTGDEVQMWTNFYGIS